MSSEGGVEIPGRGELIVVSAPSGAGKSSLIRRVLRDPRLADGLGFSVSHTTRPPRSGEVDGRHYHFVSGDVFAAMVADGEFLESARVHGRLYGTSLAEVARHLDAGRDVVLDIDVQGAQQVTARWPDAVTVFVLPPTFEELERRLRGRADDTPEQVALRLRNARGEVSLYQRYEYVIVNDRLDSAAEALTAVLLSRRQRRERMRPRIERVLASFTS